VNTEQNQAALAEAWSGTVTPYSQIKDQLGLDVGQYDFIVGKLEPQLDKNGLYCIVGEFPVTNPTGFLYPYKRTLYVGTHKDPMAKLPDTRLNNSALRFLKNIAKANNVPTNDQSDAALCTSILGRAFGCPIVESKPYKDAHGNDKKGGTEFGRNVTPAGMIPARVYATPVANGAAGTPTAAPALTGASFGTE